MKIVFNSKEKEAACTVFYKDAFSLLPNFSFFDYDNYHKYDIALFMTYLPDIEDMKQAKLNNPKLKTAIIDPRTSGVIPYLKYADFLIVDSIEMRDFWAWTGKPIHEYAEYPSIKPVEKKHTIKEKVIIGYHGNKIHLECMYKRISPALEQLADEYDIEFWAIYNIETLGEWKFGVPKTVKIKHIQWSKQVYHKYLTQVDIGINPSFVPVNDKLLKKPFFKKKIDRFNSTEDDYLLRFKMSSNPGRIIVWGLLGVPVVSDFIPSAMRIIEDGENGFLAYSEGGWFQAIEKLIISHSLRQEFSDKMKHIIAQKYDFNIQNIELINFLNNQILHQKK